MYNKIVSTQRSAGQILLIAATLDQEHTNLRVAAPELSSLQRLERISVNGPFDVGSLPSEPPRERPSLAWVAAARRNNRVV